MSDRDLGGAATGDGDGSDSDDGGLKLPDNELGFRPLRLPSEAAMFFGDLELDEELATMEILAGEGDAVEAIRCHAPILALRSTEIMKELLLCEDPPTPDEPLVLEVRLRRSTARTDPPGVPCWPLLDSGSMLVNPVRTENPVQTRDYRPAVQAMGGSRRPVCLKYAVTRIERSGMCSSVLAVAG
jgi:hypothetical protein